MMYSLTLNPEIILREEDQAWIPLDPTNRDCQEYYAWLQEGNTPKPAPVPPPPPALDANILSMAERLKAMEGRMARVEAMLEALVK